MDLQSEIIKGLKARFNFKSEKGKWFQQGKCPDCGQLELYCASEEPKIVKCGRVENCGYEETVRQLLPDLFEDWSKRAPPTDTCPTATADNYLNFERGLPFLKLRGHYTQELFRDRKDQVSATIRFPLPGGSYWERLIDRPGRFDRKAMFKPGASYAGHCWIPPHLDFEMMAIAPQIWIAEGIFDAYALCQAGLIAVSAMSVNNWPEHFLSELEKAVAATGQPKRRPELVFAFDVGPAGVKFTKQYAAKARAEGWEATAAQVRPDGEGNKFDWNDLWLRQKDWNGDKSKGPLGSEAIETFLYNGRVTIAETPLQKAKLLQERNALRSFPVRFENRMFWAASEADDEGTGTRLATKPICDCAFTILYREWDEILNQAEFFVQIDFPGRIPTRKARFSNTMISTSSEFKKGLMRFGGLWSGTGEQLDRIIGRQPGRHKEIEPLDFTGYSARHHAWVLGDLAVREGRVQKINSEKYFDFGKAAVKLKTNQQMLHIDWQPDRIDLEWVEPLWDAWGPKGLIALAFWMMSLFAEQIRKQHSSLAFLEIVGDAGSGKSTIVFFLWKLFGRMAHEGWDPNLMSEANFGRNMIKISNMPFGIIESKRDEADQQSRRSSFNYQNLLTLFNGGTPRGTGMKTGGNETYEPPFRGSIYLMQNERVTGMTALLERLMPIWFDKSQWTDASKIAAETIRKWPIESVSGTIIHVIRHEEKWLKAFFERVTEHEDALPAQCKALHKNDELHNSRIILNHAQLAASVELLPLLFPKIRREWVEQTFTMIADMAIDRQRSSSANHPVVERFWEAFDWLVSRETADQYAKGNSLNLSRKRDSGTIAVNLPMFEARAKSAGLTLDKPEDIRKYLKRSRTPKYLRQASINPPSIDGDSDKRHSCWIFETVKARNSDRVI